MTERAETRGRSSIVLPLALVAASGVAGMLVARWHRAPDALPVAAESLQRQASGGSGTADMSAPFTAPAPTGAERRPPEVNAAPQASTTAAVPPAPEPGTPGDQTERREIDLVLRRWQAALLSNDAARIAPSYAKHVDRYFLQTNVSRAYVRAYLQGEESRGWRLTEYNLSDVQVQPINADEVDVRFVAGFTVRTDSGGRAGGARTLLKLRPEDGDWKIFFERDFTS